jgi:hypothetical protein
VGIASKVAMVRRTKKKKSSVGERESLKKTGSENGDLNQMRNFKKWVIFPLNIKISNLHEK